MTQEKKFNEAEVREIASIAWKAAANAYRMYPDNKHTFSDYWDTAKSQFEYHFTAAAPATPDAQTQVGSLIARIEYESEYPHVSKDAHAAYRHCIDMIKSIPPVAQTGLRWVKASEAVPDKHKQVKMKWADGETEWAGWLDIELRELKAEEAHRLLWRYLDESAPRDAVGTGAKFYCQHGIEGGMECVIQCEHCKDYYKPIESLDAVEGKAKNIQVDFTGPVLIDANEEYPDGIHGYVATIPQLKIVETGITKQDALNECVKSFAVLVAYLTDLKVPAFIASHSSGAEDSDAVEFCEWADENRWMGTSIPGQKEKYWHQVEYTQVNDKLILSEEITTPELYKIWKLKK